MAPSSCRFRAEPGKLEKRSQHLCGRWVVTGDEFERLVGTEDLQEGGADRARILIDVLKGRYVKSMSVSRFREECAGRP